MLDIENLIYNEYTWVLYNDETIPQKLYYSEKWIRKRRAGDVRVELEYTKDSYGNFKRLYKSKKWTQWRYISREEVVDKYPSVLI